MSSGDLLATFDALGLILDRFGSASGYFLFVLASSSGRFLGLENILRGSSVILRSSPVMCSCLWACVCFFFCGNRYPCMLKFLEKNYGFYTSFRQCNHIGLRCGVTLYVCSSGVIVEHIFILNPIENLCKNRLCLRRFRFFVLNWLAKLFWQLFWLVSDNLWTVSGSFSAILGWLGRLQTLLWGLKNFDFA